MQRFDHLLLGQRAPLLYQFLNPDEYLVGECATDRNVYHFQIHAVIKDLSWNSGYPSCRDNHQAVGGNISCEHQKFSYTGSMAFLKSRYYGYPVLPNGAYVIQVVDETNSSHVSEIFQANFAVRTAVLIFIKSIVSRRLLVLTMVSHHEWKGRVESLGIPTISAGLLVIEFMNSRLM